MARREKPLFFRREAGRGAARVGVCALLLVACGKSPGEDGSNLGMPFSSLAGGMVFATSALHGSRNYDLYWVPIPPADAATEQSPIALTSAAGSETQPSVAHNGNGLAYATDDGIFVLASTGRFRRISNTSGTNFADSIPAVSPNADRVAWVRADKTKMILMNGNIPFFESHVMIANFDGSDIQDVLPRQGVIQDAPAWDPTPQSTRLAWTEFAASTFVPQVGPRDYGVWIQDLTSNSGRYACKSAADGSTPGAETLMRNTGVPFRCFGEHLVWPVPTVLVLGQDLLEIHLDTGTLSESWNKAVTSAQATQVDGIPQIQSRGDGFFPAFPISASYSTDGTKMVFDGVFAAIAMDVPTLGFMAAAGDGSATYRIRIAGYSGDLDTAGTVNFLFSLATPQIIPVATQ
jgi:hypothetical protein